MREGRKARRGGLEARGGRKARKARNERRQEGSEGWRSERAARQEGWELASTRVATAGIAIASESQGRVAWRLRVKGEWPGG